MSERAPMTVRDAGLLLALLAIVAAFASLLIGEAALTPSQVLEGLMGTGDEQLTIIVRELRLPRVVLGLMVGASLGLSGALLQGLLRNPLADPGVVGITASAGFGAVAAIYLGISGIFSLAVPLMALLGAMAATLILFAVASRDASSLTLILTGIGISSLATALISLVMNFAPTPLVLVDMVNWLLGSLANRSTADMALAAPLMIAGWIAVIGTGRQLDALSLGEDAATTLGVNMRALKWRVVLATSLSVGASVAVCGSIGFVGLVVPHLARAMVGHQPGRILGISAIGGGLVITLADMLTRLPFGQTELRLGVVTALIGAPVFLYVVYKTREAMR